MEKPMIRIRGAAEHNLKHINVDIPRNELVVITGLSGSGKSSLAFDTIYAEGQRRYMESLSSYARQFLGQMDKPDVESIEGLSPAISIDQKSTNHNPRSTVGTVTEIYDYLRLLYARVGIPHCPECGREIRRQTIDQMVDQLMSYPGRTRMQILAPVVRGKKGRHEKVLADAARRGFVRARVDGEIRDLGEEIELEKNNKHNIEIVVDRISVREGIETRLTDSLETALGLTDGLAQVDVDGEELLSFSQHFSCPDCGISLEEIEPRSFSFNNPFGACPACAGLGYTMKFDVGLVVDEEKSFAEGCINGPGWVSSKSPDSFSGSFLRELAAFYHIDLTIPFKDYPEDFKQAFLYDGFPDTIAVHYKSQRGRGVYDVKFPGLLKNLEQRYEETPATFRAEYEKYMRFAPCAACGGRRLKKTSLAVTVGGINIIDLTDYPVGELRKKIASWQFSAQEAIIAAPILKEIRARLGFLDDVGLGYLSLSRAAASLSGGESQRIRLATQVGSGLVGVSYILDEPSIGLHQRDNEKLLASLKHLRDLGNSVIVVEHDEDTMLAADTIVDIGPGPGEHGGEVVAVGTAQDIMNTPGSVTGDYLSGRKKVPVPALRRSPKGFLTIRGARENNLQHIDVRVPLGVFTCVTGVSGSGKSSLINEILYKTAARQLYHAKDEPGKSDGIEGLEQIDKVIAIDQSPIGRTPRSNPATYTGVFDLIRDLFAETPDAKARGYKKGRFSFNVKGGRCEACRGDGILKIEMHFLADVYVPCEVCGGKRYNRETLEVRYKDKNIADVLNMTVEEALALFEHVPAIARKLSWLNYVGLGYIRLGQPSTTLSGGEAQRVKLATELSRAETGRTLYILDEPTTGLHFADVHKLTEILQRLTEGGNTVIVIEHNLDVIKTADYLLDLGPEGGDGGGRLIAEGTPEEVAKQPQSYTGQFLKKYLSRGET
ncbi:MAG: excinuclease ABC subunit UvrA [Lachnospiraceae bacterium]|nr:excinuclease ABC subunit UvrA [Lachnospiraceae bacterium]